MMNYGESVPEFVKLYRAYTGYTQEELAKLLKINPQYVSNVERGIYRRPLAFCYKLVHLLDEKRAVWLEELLTSMMLADVGDKRLKKHKRKK